MPETKVTVGPHRASCSRDGALLPVPGNTNRINWRVARGRARSLKREEEKEERENARPYIPHPVFQFSSPSVGRRLAVAEGHALAWTEIACMSWKIPVLRAQDKDVRPDTEESCQECLQ